MKKEEENSYKEIELISDIAISTHNVFWQPMAPVRWKKINIDKISYGKILQQLWRSNIGEEEWRDVPEAD